MDRTNELPENSIRLGHCGWLMVVLWTAAVFASVLWMLHSQSQETQEVAKAQARAAHARDIIYRRWNATHGGVYVRCQ